MIVGVSMVKDEADIIGPILQHLTAEGVDHLIVADNLSTDGTRDILEDHAQEHGNLTILEDPVVGYYQATKMTGLAHKAGQMGAHWIVPFDADEVWYSPHGTIAEMVAISKADKLPAVGWDHLVTPQDEPGPIPDRLSHRRRQRQKLMKVAFRYSDNAQLHMGNHDVDNVGAVAEVGVLELRHFQYRSFAQYVRKLRNGREAYEATDIHPMHGTHWREGGAKSDETLEAEWVALCNTPGLVYDPAPLRR